MRKIIFALGLLAAPAVYAQQMANTANFDKFVHRVTGGLHTVSFGSAGTVLATSPNTDLVPGGGWHRAGSAAIWQNPASPSDFVDSRKAKIPISSKFSLPVTVGSAITKSSVAAAALRCFGNPICFTLTTVAGSAISDWAANSGVRYNNASGYFEGDNRPVDDGYGYSCSPSWVAFSDGRDGYNSCTATGACTRLADGRSFRLETGAYGNLLCWIGYQGFAIIKRGAAIGGVEPSWAPISNQQAFDRLNSSSFSPSPNIVPELLAGGQTIERQRPKIRPDVTTIEGEKVITRDTVPKEGGGTATREREKTTYYDIEETEDGVKVIPRTVTTVSIDGVPQPDQTTTEEGKPSDEKAIEVCGLPDTPACKIDEEGTPEPEVDTSKKDIDDAINPIKIIIDNPISVLPELPALRWDFALPTGCTSIATPAFSPFLSEIDICPFQSVFHDIMSMVWVLGGLFGAISMFWRSTFAKG